MIPHGPRSCPTEDRRDPLNTGSRRKKAALPQERCASRAVIPRLHLRSAIGRLAASGVPVPGFVAERPPALAIEPNVRIRAGGELPLLGSRRSTDQRDTERRFRVDSAKCSRRRKASAVRFKAVVEAPSRSLASLATSSGRGRAPLAHPVHPVPDPQPQSLRGVAAVHRNLDQSMAVPVPQRRPLRDRAIYPGARDAVAVCH